MRDSETRDFVVGSGSVVCGVCLSALGVVSDVFDDEARDVGGCEFLDECVDVYCVKSFGHVKRCDDCSFGGFFVVEAGGDGVVDLVKSCTCGVLFFEAVLMRELENVFCDVGEDDFFERFSDG